MLKYIAGNVIDDIALFTDTDNVTPIDPTTVQVVYSVLYAGTINGPRQIRYTGASTPATGAIARLSAGVYEVWLDTTLLPGYWSYDWISSGVGQAGLSSSAIVQSPQPFWNS